MLRLVKMVVLAESVLARHFWRCSGLLRLNSSWYKHRANNERAGASAVPEKFVRFFIKIEQILVLECTFCASLGPFFENIRIHFR